MNRRRQQDIIPGERAKNLHVTLIGAGAVGSETAIRLGKMGIGKITAYDPDVVSDHNLPNQMYRLEDIDKLKVEALSEIFKLYVDDSEFIPVAERYQGQNMTEVTISAVDSMDSRQFIWTRVKNQHPDLYIDSRMGAEMSQVFCIINGYSPTYEELRLFSSEEAQHAPCTEKATVYGAGNTAGMICAAVRRHLTGLPIIGAHTIGWIDGFTLIEEA